MILALKTITMDLLLSIFYLFNVNNRPVNVLNTTLLLTLNSFNNFTRTKSRLYKYSIKSIQTNKYWNCSQTYNFNENVNKNWDNFSNGGQISTQPIEPNGIKSFILVHCQAYIKMTFHLLELK